MRLLQLYESGLPAWAVFLPSYGLYYRPWLRTATWLAFVLVSVFSMALGFWDLWRNVPYLRTALATAFRPAAIAFEWLEAHTQVRTRQRSARARDRPPRSHSCGAAVLHAAR